MMTNDDELGANRHLGARKHDFATDGGQFDLRAAP
jgi:hypothetical protein